MTYRSLDIRHDGQFALYPTDNPENQNFDKNEKNVWRYITLHIRTITYDDMIYHS